jgi:hypothetical protein
MANVLNEFFASIFTDEGDGQMPEEDQMEGWTLNDIQINTAEVAKNKRVVLIGCTRPRKVALHCCWRYI